MSYCTQADLVARFGESELVALTDETGQGVIDATKVAQAITDAAADIDGHLQGRYVLPLEHAPRVLTRIACDLARYYLMDNRPTEAAEKRYTAALSFLRSVAKGDIGLGLDSGGDAATGGGGPEYSAPDRVFGDDGLSGY